MKAAGLLTVLLYASGADNSSAPNGLEHWPADARARQTALESSLLDSVQPERLRAFHEALASKPHDAGTPGDDAVVDRMAQAFEDMGLEVQKHPVWVYLPRPISASVQIVSPQSLTLDLIEPAVEGDPYVTADGVVHGWNAYSGSGEVTAEIVYANRGRLEDFEELKELGVDCTGKIVVARYGGNYRGYKAKFAEAAGAAGLIIFTDPADSGYRRGLMYPEGGYANRYYIQRGSIKTLPYQGDPLTPFVEATEHAERLDPQSLALPKIPVQPMGWGAAEEILSRMTGPSAPQEWQGGLPFRYRLEGGADLRVRLQVQQERRIRKTHNVLATVPGRTQPAQRIIVGCHHDAWGFGASDPSCGMMTVMEAARVVARAVRDGHPIERSITFAAWGAEEYGIIGSVEWVESQVQALQRDGVAYINLDMAAMGPRFRASASPTLQRVVAHAARAVPAIDAQGAAVIDGWLERSVHDDDSGLPRFGSLGGGSDHVGFLALAGVPCVSMGAGGAKGTSYHSNYDNLAWYQKVVGADYASGTLVTQMAALTAVRLANSPLLPIDVAWTGVETHRHLEGITSRGRQLGVLAAGDGEVAVELLRVDAAAHHFAHRAALMQARINAAVGGGTLRGAALDNVNRLLRAVDRAWLYEPGMPGRPWYRNMFAAPDEDSGYAAWMLPMLRHAVERADAAALRRAEGLYLQVFERLNALLDEIVTAVPQTVR